jgi:hypothetical protein
MFCVFMSFVSVDSFSKIVSRSCVVFNIHFESGSFCVIFTSIGLALFLEPTYDVTSVLFIFPISDIIILITAHIIQHHQRRNTRKK